MADRLRIVIAEDNYLVREGTRRLLEDSGEVDVVGTASNAEELLLAVEDLRPSAVLTDIRMPLDTRSKESKRPRRSGHGIRRSGWWCFHSTLTPPMRCSC